MKKDNLGNYKAMAFGLFGFSMFFTLANVGIEYFFYGSSDFTEYIWLNIFLILAIVLIRKHIAAIVVYLAAVVYTIPGLFNASQLLSEGSKHGRAEVIAHTFTIFALLSLAFLAFKYGIMDDYVEDGRYKPIFALPAVIYLAGNLWAYLMKGYIVSIFFQMIAPAAGGIFCMGLCYFEMSKPVNNNIQE